MPEPPLSPSQQVERIREILVGRQMQVIEDRLERLERLIGDSPIRKPGPLPTSLPTPPTGPEETFVPDPPSSHLSDDQNRELSSLRSLVSQTDKQLKEVNLQLGRHDQIFSEDLRTTLEELNTSLAARIDARSQEVLDYFESELRSLQDKLNRDLKEVEKLKADRVELQSRFAQIAEAAMGEDPSPLEPREGYTP